MKIKVSEAIPWKECYQVNSWYECIINEWNSSFYNPVLIRYGIFTLPVILILIFLYLGFFKNKLLFKILFVVFLLIYLIFLFYWKEIFIRIFDLK